MATLQNNYEAHGTQNGMRPVYRKRNRMFCFALCVCLCVLTSGTF